MRRIKEEDKSIDKNSSAPFYVFIGVMLMAGMFIHLLASNMILTVLTHIFASTTKWAKRILYTAKPTFSCHFLEKSYKESHISPPIS